MAIEPGTRPADLLERLLPLWSSPRLLETPPPQLADDVLEIVEGLRRDNALDQVDRRLWHQYLQVSCRSRFLLSLPSRERRYRWAETTFDVIRHSNFRLLDMFNQRVEAHPDRPLLQELKGKETTLWSYSRIARLLQSIAATFYCSQPTPPRVAIISENCVESACSDLACLFYGIFVTPLSVHFDAATLAWIFDHLAINIVVTDTDEQRARLESIRSQVKTPFKVFLVGQDAEQPNAGEEILRASCAHLGAEEFGRILAFRPHKALDDTATVMFTSGSTGKPKGIVFTEYNLISKRFARGAALPRVGDAEVLLCYLPLFHTFGRYLELLGSVYWGGTYTLAGNPSAETLMAGLRQVQPTGLIGVPFRWMQLRDHCLERMGHAVSVGQQEAIFRRTVGERLHWGLSAAGYLDPKVFHFFNRHGVDLCSGFGMTEATGGITMTPPGEYFDDSVGIPLPGVRVRLGAEGELQIAGPYIARYLDDEGQAPDQEYYLATGDLFEKRDNGHFEIIDRIKDIYKNSKGQTIAPRRIEQRFVDVPGIARTFLVGDGRAYNVLLIVPDRADSVLQSAGSPENVREYFHQIIAAVNQDLAPYERVVNFAILDRDLEIQRGELTAKGSLRRKVVEEHFHHVIHELYRKTQIELEVSEFRVRIPRWFFRDLGILEDDILVTEQGLRNRRRDLVLPIKRDPDSRMVRIGDLEYRLDGQEIDLGLFARQPRLWIGNRSLVHFCPCREGWDVPLESLSPQILLPWDMTGALCEDPTPEPLPLVHNHRIKKLHNLCGVALYCHGESARQATERLARMLPESDDRVTGVIQRRLEALARHPEIRVRALAYRTLLLDEPVQDYSQVFPAFIQSGLPFLDEESIEAITRARFEQRRLEALRQRLHVYRTQLEWPTTPVVREQFANLLKLLVNFARYHWEAYSAVREELAAWRLHRSDPELAQVAEGYFDEMAEWCRSKLEERGPTKIDWSEKVVFEEGLSDGEIQILKGVLFGTTMLEHSIMLAFDEPSFDIREVPAGGIWVTRVIAKHQYVRYVITVNTESGKHFDLQLVLREDLDTAGVRETMFWVIAVGGFAHGLPVLPRFGCCRPELGAMSTAYVNDLTVWERIREFTTIRPHRSPYVGIRDWRKLFIRAIAAVFRAWRNSDYRIVPGAIAPSNVVVPEPDFRQGSCVLSLTGWTPYQAPLSLVRPLVLNFYQFTIAHSPWAKEHLNYTWIFEGCVEALGVDKANEFLGRLDRDLGRDPVESYSRELQSMLREYRRRLDSEYHPPLGVECAIDRFREWETATPQATPQAREQMIDELYRLYRLDRFPDLARYYLYRHTYFARLPHSAAELFDILLREMFARPTVLPTQMPEVSDVQAALTAPEDRSVFTRVVFPKASAAQRVEVLSVGESERRQVIVRSTVVDKQGVNYTVREPLEPAEIGQLYRLLFNADFPKVVSEQDRYLVCLDRESQIVGGVCYRRQDDEVAHLDGVVVTQSLKGRGIGTALLEDFCLRMAAENLRVVKTHFFLRQFCLPRGFQVDRRWGGLVRFLTAASAGQEETI